MRARTPVVALLASLVIAAPASAALQPRLERALHVPHVSLAATGAVALDLSTGQTVYARNASLPLIPASNEKLTVTYGALTALGPDFRIETDVLQDDAGNLILKGYGDPTLSSAQLRVLARQVRAAGITTVAGSVLGDESWFDTRRTALGWKPSF
jgi:serine-type D-Ala-D-Ala carboxypeptidase/endopeptidase (penicillin-binding protein 4)